MKQAVILFTRVPIPGQTKTRMMPELSPADCARLHTCFLKDIRKELEKIEADLYIAYTPKGNADRLKWIFGGEAEYFPQKGSDLGEKMSHALENVFGMGYDSCILMGADVPELLSESVVRSFELLIEHDVVLGPTVDGGYYLVGMKKPQPAIFQVKSYGKESVLAGTLRAAEDAGLTVGLTDLLADMDTVADLNDYRRRMRENWFLQKTETGRFLAKIARISVIVPIYNEEKTIDALLDQLEPLKESCEILLVDGGSTDGTLEKIRPGFQVLHSEKGRARQMNLGAKESHGDILFFLHCDSELPRKPLAEIRRVMKNHSAGCFGIAFHSLNFFMFTCRMISNHRIKDRKVMFGDQGIFVDRELFFEAGMFPEIAVMEDYQFSLTLKEKKVKLGMTRRRIYTSDRRFPKGTIPKLRLMWKMNRLRKMYRDGVPAETISRLYQDIR